MKAILCCGGQPASVHIHSFGRDWTACECGNVRAKWLDERAGTMVAAAADRAVVRFLGMDNRMLLPMMVGIGRPVETFRTGHEICTNAPGYVFDKSRFGCWAVIAEIGSTTDTRWATPEEMAETGIVARRAPITELDASVRAEARRRAEARAAAPPREAGGGAA